MHDVAMKTWIVFLMFVAAAAFADEAWVGVATLNGVREPLQLHIDGEHAEIALRGPRFVPVKTFERHENHIRFDTFEGTEHGDTIRGTNFELKRIAAGPAEHREGLYELAPGHVVLINSTPMGQTTLDTTTDEVRQIFESAPATFFSGPALGLALPVETTLRFTGDGVDFNGVHAKKLRFVEQEVTFTNNDVTLSGTLVLPNAPPPYAALIRTHGGGPAQRNVQTAESSAYAGVAMLTYDKRGTGKSTGDWQRASMNDLAGDAVAAAEFLAKRDDIDKRHIGVIGASQAGWVNVIAASQSPLIRFIVLSSGETQPMIDNITGEIESAMREDGIPEEQIARALPVRRQMYLAVARAARTGDWAPVEALAKNVEHEQWFAYVRPPRSRFAPNVDWLQMNVDVDPTPLWERTTIPVLALFGGKDTEVYASRAAPRLQSMLTRAKNPDFTIKVFPEGNHEGFEAVTGYESEFPRLHRYSPGYFRLMNDWIAAHTGTRLSGTNPASSPP